jgi:hypothetical protein
MKTNDRLLIGRIRVVIAAQAALAPSEAEP